MRKKWMLRPGRIQATLDALSTVVLDIQSRYIAVTNFDKGFLLLVRVGTRGC